MIVIKWSMTVFAKLEQRALGNWGKAVVATPATVAALGRVECLAMGRSGQQFQAKLCCICICTCIKYIFTRVHHWHVVPSRVKDPLTFIHDSPAAFCDSDLVPADQKAMMIFYGLSE